jgi:DNA polymerase
MDRTLLFEYLRQRVELGDRELYFDTLTSSDFVRAISPVPISHTNASSLPILAQEAAACTACGLHASRRQAVFARGNPLSPLMIVGEAPGEEEDKTGLPFVGRAGKLLDVLLASIGFPRDSAYICNVLKCRPPQNRNPLPNEIDACSRFLRAQIEIVAPKVLLAVGKFAAQTLVQSEETIGRLRGQIHQYSGLPVVVTYHPAYLLRSPQATRVAWHDFQLVRTILDEQT